MAIKIGFYGADCYDLVQYLSRVLFKFKYKVLMIDRSQDKGLESTIPIPKGLEKSNDTVMEYRGVDYSDRYMKSFNKYYDYIILYYGRGAQRILKSDWMVIVDDGDIRTTRSIQDVMQKMPVILSESKATKSEDGYEPAEPVCISLGPIARNISFEQYAVSKQNIDMAEMDMDDLTLKCYCQLNNIYKFDKLSGSYHDLLYKIVISVLEKEYKSREIKQVFKAAEKGN